MSTLNSGPRGSSCWCWLSFISGRPSARGWPGCPHGPRSRSAGWSSDGACGRSGRSPASVIRMPSSVSSSPGTGGLSFIAAGPTRSRPSPKGSNCSARGDASSVPGSLGPGHRGSSCGGISATSGPCVDCGSRLGGVSEGWASPTRAILSEIPVTSCEPFSGACGLWALVTRRSRHDARGRPLYSGRIFGWAHRADRETRRFWNMVHE